LEKYIRIERFDTSSTLLAVGDWSLTAALDIFRSLVDSHNTSANSNIRRQRNIRNFWDLHFSAERIVFGCRELLGGQAGPSQQTINSSDFRLTLQLITLSARRQ
jgi:hypothetical protein